MSRLFFSKCVCVCVCACVCVCVRVCAGGHAEIVRLLVENGAEVNVMDGALTTPLHNAAYGEFW